MSFTSRVARNFMTIKAAKALREEIEKAGVDVLTTLAEKGISIVGTYLKGLSPENKEKYRRYVRDFVNMGVTVETVLDELYRQIPELSSIMKTKTDYLKTELQMVQDFLEGKI